MKSAAIQEFIQQYLKYGMRLCDALDFVRILIPLCYDVDWSCPPHRITAEADNQRPKIKYH